MYGFNNWSISSLVIWMKLKYNNDYSGYGNEHVETCNGNESVYHMFTFYQSMRLKKSYVITEQ